MLSQTPASHSQFQTSNSRWHALTHRVPSSHSTFLYGVKTTKIYCRPTCTARLARRANIVFYDTKAEAIRDGYRPCQKCRPDDVDFKGEQEELVTKALVLLKDGRATQVRRGLKALAEQTGVTQSYLCRVFKNVMGMTIGTYMKEFESESADGDESRHTESSNSSPIPSDPGPIISTSTASTSTATTSIPFAPLEDCKGDSRKASEPEYPLQLDPSPEPQSGMDLDRSFNFDDWLWDEDFLKDIVCESTAHPW